MARKVTPEVKAAVLDLYLSGAPVRSIAAAVGLSQGRISDIAKECGYTRRERCKFTKNALIALIRQYEGDTALRAMVDCGEIQEDEIDETRAQLVRIREIIHHAALDPVVITKKEPRVNVVGVPVMVVPDAKQISKMLERRTPRHPHVLESGR